MEKLQVAWTSDPIFEKKNELLPRAHIFYTVGRHLPKLHLILPLYWTFEVWKWRIHHNVIIITGGQINIRAHTWSFMFTAAYTSAVYGGWFVPFRYFVAK